MKDKLVVSAFQFFQELNILEIRLETLDPVIDYFILSESTKTHSGKEKPLYYDENKNRFKKFHHKIIHQIIRDTPSNYTNLIHNDEYGHDHIVDKINAQTHWPKNVESYGRDSWEKECLILPLLDLGFLDDTIVMLSDCDEIAKPQSVNDILENFDSSITYHLQHYMYYYYLNLRKNEPWYGSLITTLKNFKENSFCTMRQNKRGRFIENSGWHYSYQGSIDTIKNKIESFGEQSLNLDWVKNGLEDNVENAISLGKDLYNRPCKFWIEPISYKNSPKYLVDNQEKFKNYIYKGVDK